MPGVQEQREGMVKDRTHALLGDWEIDGRLPGEEDLPGWGGGKGPYPQPLSSWDGADGGPSTR